jgi:hypothetical protein
MTKIILLDSTPVGLITNPKSTPLSTDCQQWFYSLFDRRYSVVLPEIINYEVRRELLRVNRSNSIRRLDLLKSEIIYLPITTEVMLKALICWLFYVLEFGLISGLKDGLFIGLFYWLAGGLIFCLVGGLISGFLGETLIPDSAMPDAGDSSW